MKTYTYFVGNDLGKSTIAVCVINTQEKLELEMSIANTKAGMETLLKRLEKLPGFTFNTTLLCMEHTGIYCQPLVSFFYPKGADLWLDSAVRTKHSLGIKRGKPTRPMPVPSLNTLSETKLTVSYLLCLMRYCTGCVSWLSSAID